MPWCRRKSGSSGIALCLESLVLGPPDLIDCFSKMFGDVNCVTRQLGIWKLIGYGVGVGRKHVRGDRPNLLPLLEGQRLDDSLSGRLGSFLGTSRTREPSRSVRTVM
jgi:hypothetical protein